ncbi:hypothetical protein [Microbulbifer sp. ALW1]|uniref:ECs_2282 family putative zinc-binding protein n=1 Tax=Microbulbifer sp. (strain ALW1) TaxID=1516059 RepID=UPI00135C2FDE|nr:hypothetical protein [Microbulbifer sp. ALW1]
MSSDTITLHCAKCRSEKFEIPRNPKPNDVITCGGCGAQAKYGAIRDAALKQAKDLVAKQFRDLFKS